MIKEYRNRKQMLRELPEYTAFDLTGYTIEKFLNRYLIENDFTNYKVKTLSLSFGTYGVNGGTFEIVDRNNSVTSRFFIKERSSLLFKLMNEPLFEDFKKEA